MKYAPEKNCKIALAHCKCELVSITQNASATGASKEEVKGSPVFEQEEPMVQCLG